MEQSSGSLRFKISLSKQEMEHEEPESFSKDTSHKTSYSLYIVLSEIHRLCVKRDHKGIFARPVTEDIAPNYFSFISNPMDLGTIYTRLSSRNYYSTAGQYLDDLRLMCQNAMLYNPPDTIYYQKARKMLSFAEKQMSPQGLRKFAAELLKTSRPLTDEEMGISTSETPKQNHHRGSHHGHHGHRHYQEDAQPGPSSRYSTSMSVPKLKEEILEKSDEVEDYAARSVEREELDGTPSSSYSSQLKRRPSNASMSSASATKVPRYANSPPHLIPEVDESFAGRIDSPRTQSTCGRSDAITIDLENAEGDQVDYPFGTSPGSSSTISSSANRSSRRPARNVNSRRSSSTTKRVAPNQRQSCASSRSRRKLAATAAVEQRTYAEDAWTFTDTMTDRTPPDQVIAQVKVAAQNARTKHLEKFGQPGRQTVVYLDTSETGKIYAKPCGGGNVSSNSLEGWGKSRKLVNYPLAMRQLLTPRAKSTGMIGYHGLIEQMTSQQVATLHALSNLRYDPSEPIAMSIHGPLAIFEKDELAQMIDAYGGASDLTVVESVLSLLTFVEPIGVEARRVAHLRLADATDGYHAQMLISFADPESPYYSSNWMKRANLTIDPSIVDEFKTKFEEEIAEKAADAASLISNESTSATTTSSVPLSVTELQTLSEESVSGGNATASGGQMSIAKLPSNTLTTNTTDKQMTAFQPQQNSAEEAETTSNEQDEEDRKDEEEEEGEGSFDILTEALNAAIVTPSDRNQPVLPDAVTVNELAQISALTAAISPIQQNFMPLPTSPIQHSPGVPTTSAVPQNIPMIVSGGSSISTPIPLSIIGQSGEPKFIPVLASGTQIYSSGVPISSIPPQITPVPTPLQMGNTPICQSELAQNVEPNSLPVQDVTEKAVEPLNILMSTSLESPQSMDTQICQSVVSQEIDIASVPGVPNYATAPFQEGQNIHVMEKTAEPSNIPESIQSEKTQAYQPEVAEKGDVQESSKPDISSFNPNVVRVNSPHIGMSEPQNSLEEPNANLVPGETPETTLKSVVSVQELLESSCAQDQADVDDKRRISLLSESQEISINPSQKPLPTGSIQSTSRGTVSETTIFQGNQSVAVVESSVEPLNILLVEHLHSPGTQICQSDFIATKNVAKEPSEVKSFSLDPTSISETSLPHFRSNGSALSKDMENIPRNMLGSEDVDQKSIETSILQTQLIMEENAENSLEETQQRSLYECSSEEALEDSEDKLNTGIQVGGHEIGSPEHQQKGLGEFDVEDQSKCTGMYLGGSQQESSSDPVPIKSTAENKSGSSEMDVNEVEPNYDDHGTDQESISQPQIYDQKPSDDIEIHSDLSSEARKYQQEFLDIESAKDVTEPRSNEHLTEVRKELYQESTEANSHLMDIGLEFNPNLQEFEGPLAGNKEEVFVNDSSTNDLQLGLVNASEDLGFSNDLIPAVSHIEPSSMEAYTINSPSKVCNEPSEDYPVVTVAKQDTNSDLKEPVDSSISDDKREFVRVPKSPNIISDAISAELLMEPSKESLDSSPLNTVVEPESNSNIEEPVAVRKDFVQEIISGKVNAETSESQFEYSVSRSYIESGRSFELQEPTVVSENDTNSLGPPESFDKPSETTHLISAQNDSFVVPEIKDLESSQVFYEENQSKDQSEITAIHSSDEQWNVATENPTANQLNVENFSEEQNSIESSIPSILPCDNASIQLDSIALLPTFETSNSPVSAETFNPQQANLDEDAQTGYPHSNTSLEKGGGLVDYDYTDSSASGSISSSSPSYV